MGFMLTIAVGKDRISHGLRTVFKAALASVWMPASVEQLGLNLANCETGLLLRRETGRPTSRRRSAFV